MYYQEDNIKELATFRLKQTERIVRKERLGFNVVFFIIFVLAFQYPSISFPGDILLPKDVSGWTIFKPSDDSRIMYVSSSGDDSTGVVYDDDDSVVGADPFNPTGPLNTFASYTAALKQAREGYPDWILFKRGDTFTMSATYAIVPTSGRSATEPALTGAYGATGASPVIKVTEANQQAVRIHRTSPNWIAISGLDFYSFTRNPLDSGYAGTSGAGQTGLYIGGTPTATAYRGFLLEGCKFRFFDESSIGTTGGPVDGLTLRRNLFADSYAGPGQSHSQGIYIYNQNSILEENIFIHNGWYSPKGEIPGEATLFNHNIYNSCPVGATYRKNIFIQGSNMNNKFTADSFADNKASNPHPILIENNLYIDGQQGIGLGNNRIGNTYPFASVTIKDNVFTDIGKSNHLQGIAWGIDIGYDSTGTVIARNLLLHQDSADVKDVIPFMTAGIQTNLNIDENIVYNWRFADVFRARATGDQRSTGSTKTNVSFANNTISNPANAGYFVKVDTSISGLSFEGNRYYSDKADIALFKISLIDYSLPGWQEVSGDNSSFGQIIFSDSTRSIETYMQSIGETATLDAFIAKCRAQDRYDWDVRFAADKVNSWIKNGFYIKSEKLQIPNEFLPVQ